MTLSSSEEKKIIYHQLVDARQLFCPEPLMLIRKQLHLMNNGQILLALCDDPTSVRDVSNFCRFIGHALLNVEHHDNHLAFWIKKFPDRDSSISPILLK